MAKLTFDNVHCKGCSLCVDFCPKKILKLKNELNAAGYHYAYCTNEDDCVACLSCATMCPDCCIKIEK